MRVKVLSRSTFTADAHVGDILDVEDDADAQAALAAGILRLLDYGNVPSKRARTAKIHADDAKAVDADANSPADAG